MAAIMGLRMFVLCSFVWYFGHAAQYAPVEGVDGNDCAVVLEGSKHFIYNSGKGSPRRSAAHMCITYDTVNRAFLDVQNRHTLLEPNEQWSPVHFARLGELLLDVSQVLAKMYDLNADDVNKFLPAIDTSKTLIRNVCPSCMTRVVCKPGKYRRPDGLCNNEKNPTWGAAMSTFNRLMTPRFSDKLSAPKISVSGQPLPMARVVSRTIHPDEGLHEHAGTVMLVAWGQFMDHDLTLTATPLDPVNRNEPEECCGRPDHLKNKYCYEIKIPEDDNFYRKHNVKCQDFVRAFPGIKPDCKLGPRSPFNLLTPVIDGNTIYGVDEAFSQYLRSGYTGQLRMNPAFANLGLKELLPMKLNIPDEGCIRSNASQYCFESGEIRVNEQLVLTCIHTLMAREHNRIAKELSQINPHWNDEMLYQEAKRIVVAEIQHITYNEFLPILLGKDMMDKYSLTNKKKGYWDGYDSHANPNILASFSAAAFRFGHSLLPNVIERWSKAHGFIASKKLSDLIRRPFDLYRAGALDEYLMGLMNQVAQAMDDSITQEVTNNLIKKPGKGFGFDLVSFNIQRGRDFGLPGYMEYRRHCGLTVANRFEEMVGFMPNSTIQRYQTIYSSPFDIDLWSGGVSEKPAPGSVVGPTFSCIIASQFSLLKKGDRFWYELPDQPSSFSPDQLQEIRNVRLARLVCDNTDIIDTVQMYPMVLSDHELNPRVPCRSGVIPRMDLSKWADTTLDTAEPNVRLSNVEKNLKSSMTEAKIQFCENCNATVVDTGIGLTDATGTRVITIIEATDELDGNAVMNSNAIFGGNDKRFKRGTEVASLAGNETADGNNDPPLSDEMVLVGLDVPKTTPIKRDATDGLPDMTQAIMEQRVDYDVDEEFQAANGHGFEAPRTRPVNNYRGYSSRRPNEELEDDSDDFDDGDHNSHYEYVPMEFDHKGNHRPLTLPNFLDSKKPVKSNKYGAPKAPTYHPRPFGYKNHGSGSSSSSSSALHGHDFVPLRGGSSGGGFGGVRGGSPASKYSYGVGGGKQTDGEFDDYHDIPSPYSGRPLSNSDEGPKSFVSMTRSNSDDVDPADVYNINHGQGSYDVVEDTPRDYHGHFSADSDDEDDAYHGHGSSKSLPKSPYFYRSGDYAYEPSSTSVQSRLHDADDKSPKSKAYWRMSYVQDV
ncbi:peroxidasin homolog [Melanaphis sacchari]|uniref:peroxidasin homolog n=1 Tax=Melanaphis sacchari TaxID=742174 RepID=UPI000DC1525D|nr:peroxidasin homolog [Melanaphis sacchari]